MSTNFDERAATWDDDPAKVARSHLVAEAIRAAVPLAGTTRLFEYGAGTGLVTLALRPYVGAVTLVDTSRGMRAVMERKVADGSLTDARISDVDLETQDPPDEQFDLVVTVMTLHHIHDLDAVLRRFAALLSPDGRLCVVDLVAEDGSFHGHGFEGHHGFDPDDLAARIARAGFRDVHVTPCSEVVRDGAAFPLFLATASVGGSG